MKKIILILCEPRTGSNLLMEAFSLYKFFRPINEFFVAADSNNDFLPHKTLLKSTEIKILSEFLNVQSDDIRELVVAINKNPIESLLKLNELVSDYLVVKIHAHQFYQNNLERLLEIPFTEIIILDRTDKLKTLVSGRKAQIVEKWHSVNTDSIKVSISEQDLISYIEDSNNWRDYLANLPILKNKHVLNLNYETDLEFFDNTNFYRTLDNWFEKIKIVPVKSNYKMHFFKKQSTF